eukprot:jgi/Tetstr1/441598/TSEL_029826.t1
MQVVHEKPETRRHVVFKHKTWDEQWVPIDEYGKQAILRDMPAEVEEHDNGVNVWKVLYFLESKAPFRPNIRKGHDAFLVALKHTEEKLCCFYDDTDIVTDQHLSKFGMSSHDVGAVCVVHI